jgi:hydroxypyruvate reductase
MAHALEQSWHGDLSGLVITRYGHSVPCQRIEVIEAGHPIPDESGVLASKRLFDVVQHLSPDDLVICLVSGGGSALFTLPAPNISLADKQTITHSLLASGATIAEINCLRKHLSASKGGRLAEACFPARVLTLAISDVPGDDPSIVASGPTVPDPSTCADALAIANRYQITLPEPIRALLEGGDCETPKPGASCFMRNEFRLIATPQQSLEAAAAAAQKAGIAAHILSDRIEGESRHIAHMHAAIARQIATRSQPFEAPSVLLSGGETTVALKGDGRGGPNAEFLLALLDDLRGHPRIYALAADTDGIDGSESNAGAIMRPDSFKRSQTLGLSTSAHLAQNDSFGFFDALGDLLVTGPTLTNVNDFRAILVL